MSESIYVDLLWVCFASVVFTIGFFLINNPLNTINEIVKFDCKIYDFIHSLATKEEDV